LFFWSGSVIQIRSAPGTPAASNAVDPRFVLPIFEAALAAGADYLDMAMSLSRPHPERPYELSGVAPLDAN
jgi:saccharopine dehydrogenase (NAD+, L-lysine-forming)